MIMTDKKKPGLAGLKETLKIDKLLSKITEVVDGKKPLANVDGGDVIGSRIKEMRDLVDTMENSYRDMHKQLVQMANLLAYLLDDISADREGSCDIKSSTDNTSAANSTAATVENSESAEDSTPVVNDTALDNEDSSVNAEDGESPEAKKEE
jgi:hypothetical protein